MALHLPIKLWENGLHLQNTKNFMAGILVGTQNDCKCVRHTMAAIPSCWPETGTAEPMAGHSLALSPVIHAFSCVTPQV